MRVIMSRMHSLDKPILRCTVADCAGRHYARSWCEKHYRRWYMHGSVDTVLVDWVRNEFNAGTFSAPLTSETAWLLGLIWSDGSMLRRCVEITSTDRVLLEQSEAILSGKNLVRPRWSAKKQAFHIQLYSDQLSQDLRNHGLVERKSHVIRWPSSLPQGLDGHFLRGVLDGDGSVLRPHGRGNSLVVLWYSGSPDFSCQIREHLEGLGIEITGTYTHAKKGYASPVFSVMVKAIPQVRALYPILYPSSLTLGYLPRKHVTYRAWMEARGFLAPLKKE